VQYLINRPSSCAISWHFLASRQCRWPGECSGLDKPQLMLAISINLPSRFVALLHWLLRLRAGKIGEKTRWRQRVIVSCGSPPCAAAFEQRRLSPVRQSAG
jgi:hypothetical protein